MNVKPPALIAALASRKAMSRQSTRLHAATMPPNRQSTRLPATSNSRADDTASNKKIAKLKQKIQESSKTKNLFLELVPTSPLPSAEDMEKILRETTFEMGLYMSHITTLSKKKYPGNRHWHFKQEENKTAAGCLDVTYWPQHAWLWISVRQREPMWVHEAGSDLKERLEASMLFDLPRLEKKVGKEQD